ncbi:MAG: hypothetical protein ACR5KV_07365 [Wolbachia sp.]
MNVQSEYGETPIYLALNQNTQK